MGGTRGGVPPIGVAAGLSRPGASPRCRLSGVVRVTRAGRVPVNRPVDSGGLRPTRPAGVSRTAGGDAAPAVAHRVAGRALSSAGRNRHPTPSHATPRGGAVAAPTPPAVQPPHHRISPVPPLPTMSAIPTSANRWGCASGVDDSPHQLATTAVVGAGGGRLQQQSGGATAEEGRKGPSCTLEGGTRARRGLERGACTVYSGPSPQHTQPLSPTRDGGGAFGRGTGRGGQRDPPPPAAPRRPVARPPSRAFSLDSSPLAVGACPTAPAAVAPPVQRGRPQRPAVLAPRPHHARTPSVPFLPPPPSVPLIPIVRRPPGGHGTVQRPGPRLFEHPSHHARGGAGERKGPHRSRRTVVCAAAGPARLARLPDHPSPPPRHLGAAFLSHPSRLSPLFPPLPPISRVCWSLTHPLPLLASTVSSTIERP